MPRNGSGGYTPPLNSWNPAINGAAATPADWQALLSDLATAIQGSIAADGQTPLSGALNANNNRIISLAAPTGAGGALRWQQMVKGADIASASTITIINEGTLFDVTGTTTITQINDSFPGRVAILRFLDAVQITNSASLLTSTGQNETTVAGDILFMANVSAGVWQVVAWPALAKRSIPVASDSQAGIVELATDVEAVDFTVGDRALVPKNLAAVLGSASLSAIFGTPGHFRVPVIVSGEIVEIIVQFGVSGAVTAAGGLFVTFPIPFPTAIISSIATIRQGGGVSAAFSAGVGGETTTGMTVFNNGTGGATSISWVAIGY